MKWSLVICFALSLSTIAKADNIFRIEFGQDYSQYKESDLKRRIWELERAVWQLQQKVFQLETSQPSGQRVDTWICQIKAMGNHFSGTGPSKAVAIERVLEKCKAANSGSGFFCKDPVCEQ